MYTDQGDLCAQAEQECYAQGGEDFTCYVTDTGADWACDIPYDHNQGQQQGPSNVPGPSPSPPPTYPSPQPSPTPAKKRSLAVPLLVGGGLLAVGAYFVFFR